MTERPFHQPAATPTAATRNRRLRDYLPAAHQLSDRLALTWEQLWVLVILVIAGLAHGINMFRFPFYETDEGTYMGQAWAVTRGELAHYTYWYDHAPWGWFQIAGWAQLTGGFYTFGSSIDSGRVLMLLFHLGSTFLLYRIARATTGSVAIASVTTLLFALSAYGIYYHRRVLLDNIATFWMLAAILPLVSGRLTLSRVWLSAAALAIAVLSKEVAVFLVPAMAYLVFYRSHPTQRWFGTVGWVALFGGIVSTYPLMALLKRELFPSGSFLGADYEHVSLIDALRTQSGRDTDGGLLDPASGFYRELAVWIEREPTLVIGGTVCALLSLLLMKWQRVAGVFALMTLSIWLFLGRGGVVIGFYLVPLLPLLALNIGMVLHLILAGSRKLLARYRFSGNPFAGSASKVAFASACVLLVLPGYTSTTMGFVNNPLTLWQNEQVEGQLDATGWIRRNLPNDSAMVIDSYMWLELQDPPADGVGISDEPWPKAHWYWRVDPDPEIREGVFQENWQTIDYIVTTLQMKADLEANPDWLTMSATALENSSVIASFDSGDYPVEVRRVRKLSAHPAPSNPILVRTWEQFKTSNITDGRVIETGTGATTSEGQGYSLLRAVYMNDRQAFDALWGWTQENLQVRGDSLLAWHYGTKPDGSLGVLDLSNATDGDQDVALALLFASQVWDDPTYQQQALEILDSIWERNTVELGGQRVVVAGNWATGDGTGGFNDAVVNPSYFAPYAYRVFAEADPAHPWMQIVDSSYNVIQKIQESPELGGTVGIIPDWVVVEAETGDLKIATDLWTSAELMSFDASRLSWRLTVDWIWSKDQRAAQAIKAFNLPAREIVETGRLSASYNPDGSPAVGYEALSMYAGTLGSLLFNEDKNLVHDVYAEQIFGRYQDDGESPYWGDPANFYDQNWAWFATLLIDGGMSNLWAGESIVQWDDAFPERY